MDPNPQDLLWSIPNMLGHGWWYLCSALAFIAMLTSFLYLIMNEKLSALLLSRVLLCAGMVCFWLIPLNSGWLPWGVLLTTSGYALASFLIATNWCHRQDKWETFRAILTGRKHADKRSRFGPSD